MVLQALGIETSCDDTAISIVDENRNIIINEISTQYLHSEYGGVVPELASRSHLTYMNGMFSRLQMENKNIFNDIDIIGVTGGPGLIGGIIVGVMFAKALSSVLKKPLISVNHLEGHALTTRLTNNTSYPFLLLLMSGGHCQFVIVYGIGNYKKIGETIDDACGEALDKVARMLGLGYPGGPVLEKIAKFGDPHRFQFPVPLLRARNCNFSFAGLKTSVLRKIESLHKLNKDKNLSEQDNSDIAASLQYCIGQIIKDRLARAIENCHLICPDCNHMVFSGGVAANDYFRNVVHGIAEENKFLLDIPPQKLCTDNAAMISWAAIERYKNGYVDGLDFNPQARWSL